MAVVALLGAGLFAREGHLSFADKLRVVDAAGNPADPEKKALVYDKILELLGEEPFE